VVLLREIRDLLVSINKRLAPPPIMLTSPDPLTEQEAEKLKKSWLDKWGTGANPT
jgi:hypothetical protein